MIAPAGIKSSVLNDRLKKIDHLKYTEKLELKGPESTCQEWYEILLSIRPDLK